MKPECPCLPVSEINHPGTANGMMAFSALAFKCWSFREMPEFHVHILDVLFEEGSSSRRGCNKVLLDRMDA